MNSETFDGILSLFDDLENLHIFLGALRFFQIKKKPDHRFCHTLRFFAEIFFHLSLSIWLALVCLFYAETGTFVYGFFDAGGRF